MKNIGRTRVWGAGIAIVVGTSLLGATGAGAADAGRAQDAPLELQGRSGNVSSPKVRDVAARRVASYWTPERMAAAEPYPVHRSAGTPAGRVTTSGKVGRPMTVEPVRAGSTGRVGQAATKVPRPYTNYPDKLVTKIFFVGADGGNYVCSGTIVNSDNKSMISTAGHCVADESLQQWHSNWLVVPAYASKNAKTDKGPYGTWVAHSATTRASWFWEANWNEDIGFLVVKKKKGKSIVQKLGAQGIKFNQDREQKFKDFGYPAAAPFDGMSQWLCASPYMKDDPGYDPAAGGPAPMGIACDMTPGSSGGGWLIKMKKGLGFVNSVNSFKYIEGPLADPNTMYGPYFGDGAKELYRYTEQCTAKTGCPAE